MPSLSAPHVLGPGANQLYTCPNNPVSPLAPVTATATGQLTISNIAYANDPNDSGTKNSTTVNTQVSVTASDTVMIIFSDYLYIYLPVMNK